MGSKRYAILTPTPMINTYQGINATADSFYSSQGRQDISFGDENQKLIESVLEKYPDCETLEMEVFYRIYWFMCIVGNDFSFSTSMYV